MKRCIIWFFESYDLNPVSREETSDQPAYSDRQSVKKNFLYCQNSEQPNFNFIRPNLTIAIKKFKTVLFSDKSKNNLKDSNGIWESREKRLNPIYCKDTIKYGEVLGFPSMNKK